jgi:hypothetical protein
MDGGVFELLTQFIHQKHCRISSDPTTPAEASTSLPAALVLAGGVNSSDHAGTFAALAKALTSQQHCYTATLNPYLFGRSAADAFNSVFSQFSGQESDVPGITQVLKWYQQETGVYFDEEEEKASVQKKNIKKKGPGRNRNAIEIEGEVQEEGDSEGNDGLDRPASKRPRRPSLGGELAGLGIVQPATATATVEDDECGGGGGDGNNPAAANATIRDLRYRRLTPGEHAAKCRANKRRPLVIIVENTEGVNALCFADFLRVLHRLRYRLPITLVVGLTTTARALKSMMPDELFDKLDCKAFRLTSAIARLDNVVQKVLLGGNGAWPGLVFGDKVMESLYNMFMIHCFSAGIVVLGLKVAVAAHFRGHAASCFAVVEFKDGEERESVVGKQDRAALALGEGVGGTDKNSGSGGSNTVATTTNSNSGDDTGAGVGTVAHVYNIMPPAAASHFKKLFLGSAAASRTTTIVETIDKAKLAFSAWSVAVQWLSEAAACVGLFKGYSHWELYRDAMHPVFVKNEEGKHRLTTLHNKLKALDQEGVVQLALVLLQIAEDTYRGGESRLAEVAKLKQFAAIGGKHKGGVGEGDAEEEGEEEERRPKDNDVIDKGNKPAAAVDATAGKEITTQATSPAKPAVIQPPAGRDRFFSKKSRTAALLAKAGTAAMNNSGGDINTHNNEGTTTKDGDIPKQQQKQQKQNQQVSPGTKFAYWFIPMLTTALQEPPSAAPGSIAFYCKESAILDRLDATPKDTVYHALTDSRAYLGSGNGNANTYNGNNTNKGAGYKQDGHGFSAEEEDAALAFQLFDQDPDCANVADWFQSFAAVHSRRIEEVQRKNLKNEGKEKQQQQQQQQKKKKEKKAGERREEKKETEEKGEGIGDGNGGGEDGHGDGDGDEDAEDVKEQEKILAARFSQAAAELQLVGLIKPLQKKKKGDFVVRTVHMPSLEAGL